MGYKAKTIMDAFEGKYVEYKSEKVRKSPMK